MKKLIATLSNQHGKNKQKRLNGFSYQLIKKELSIFNRTRTAFKTVNGIIQLCKQDHVHEKFLSNLKKDQFER